MADYRVHSISFDGEAVTLTYNTSTDVRVKGMVAVAHQVQISMEHPDYAEQVDLIERSLTRLLRDALEDFEESPPWSPADEDDDLDEEMGGSRR